MTTQSEGFADDIGILLPSIYREDGYSPQKKNKITDQFFYA